MFELMAANVPLRDTFIASLMTATRSLDPSEPISKVIGSMRDARSYEVFVEEKERTGIITIRDILATRDITKTKISNLMRHIPRMNGRSTVADAARLMFEHRIRSLPVYESGKLKGQITAGSIVVELLKRVPEGRIGNIMTSSPICVNSDDTVSKAKSLMVRRKIDQLPVLKNGRLQSAITSASIVFNTLPSTDRAKKGGWQGRGFNVSVEDFSEPDVTWNDVKDSPREVYARMLGNRTNYSIILNFDEVQGIVTYRDFMRQLITKDKVAPLPMYIIGLPEDPFEAQAAKEKFTRIIQLFQRASPKMSDARAVIKAGKTKAMRTRYEVHVSINSPLRQYSYRVSGFELPDIFDQIESWAKGAIGRSEPGWKRTRTDPGFPPESPQM